ncbi:LAQU0S07e03686g1_1 [Lachancea quebecensis]|uniref:LAQU0S07e03686g1_1 n=1 Tax=Lachancea quebecensis TaxID=1654605 RepID=A0A0P1KUX4_9SACH|nr:LAQU0S07e03686g1_1 [Lachancea quebecensis]
MADKQGAEASKGMKEVDFGNLHEKLGTDDGYKDSVKQEIQSVQNSIQPMRLRFNELLNMLAIIDRETEVPNQEKFLSIRTKIVEFVSELQAFSSGYGKLQPLFDIMQQQGKNEKTSTKFTPLERLRHLSDANLGNQAKSASGGSPSTATVLSAPPATKQTKSSTNTPTSNVATPSAAFNAATKKPRKSRSKKNSLSTGLGGHPVAAAASPVAVAAAAAAASTNAGVSMGSNPIIPQQFTPSTNPTQILSSMSPMNMMSSPMNIMSPANNTNMAYTGPAKPPVPNHRHMPTSSQQMNMNGITPANILSMSMMEQANQPHQTTAPVPQPSNQLDMNNLDLNNLDLSNLNMDFLQ